MTDNEKRFIQGIFSGDSSGHDYYHTIRVYKLATKIAKQENADVKIVQLAALLHDVDDIKLSPDTYVTKKNAVDFMTINKIDGKKIEAVCKIIDEVNKYGISKERIVAEGQGIGYMFEEPDWNRVSICTINSK